MLPLGLSGGVSDTDAGNNGKSLMKLSMTKSVFSGAGAVKLTMTVGSSRPNNNNTTTAGSYCGPILAIFGTVISCVD